MRQYKSWIAALILGSTLSANAQQKNMENKTLNENIPEMIISLEKEALASTDPMAFVELSDTDVIYFDPSLETKKRDWNNCALIIKVCNFLRQIIST